MMEKFNQLPAMARLGIFAVIAVVIFAAGWYGPVPGLGAMQDKNATDAKVLAGKREDNDRLRPFEGNLKQMEKQIADLQVQMERQKKIVPDEKSADDFIREMQRAASEAGVNLRSYESQATAQKQYYVEVPFAIELDGPFYSVVKFFEKVSAMERIVNIEGLKMGTVTGKGSANSVTKRKFDYAPTESVTVSCVAKTFYRREQPTAPAKKS